MLTKYIGIGNNSIEFNSYVADLILTMVETISSGESEETPEEFVKNENNYSPTGLLEYMSFPNTLEGEVEFECRKSQLLLTILTIVIMHADTMTILMHTAKDMCRIVPLQNGIWIEIYERTDIKPFTPCE